MQLSAKNVTLSDFPHRTKGKKNLLDASSFQSVQCKSSCIYCRQHWGGVDGVTEINALCNITKD